MPSPSLQPSPSLHAANTAAAQPPPSLPSRPAHSSASYARPLATRQGASTFNQPLSLDTSNVTNMNRMFKVCALASASTAEPFPVHAANSEAAHPTTRTSGPASYARPCDSAGCEALQPAAELQHYQGHQHTENIYSALSPCPAPDLEPDPPRARSLRRPAAQPPPPSGPHTPHSAASYALLAARQGTNTLTDENKGLIRCAWGGQQEV